MFQVKRNCMLLREKNYVSVTLKLLENISSKKKLCVIEEEIMFQSIKKKDIFCSRFQYFIGDGAIFFNLPPSLSFFCTLLFLLTVSVIFVNRRSWLPPLIPPPSKLELYLCIGQIFIKRWMCTLSGLYITQPQKKQ